MALARPHRWRPARRREAQQRRCRACHSMSRSRSRRRARRASRRIAVRAAQRSRRFRAAPRCRQPPRAVAASSARRNAPEKLRRIFALIASSYRGYARPSALENRRLDESIKLLPGQALSTSGRPRLDYLAVATLAFPFMVNSAVQAVLNATDTWFIGRVSPAATAGDRRGVLAGAGVRAAVRRRRTVGADPGGAGLRRPPLHARLAGDLDRAVGVAVHRAAVRAAGARRARGSSRPSAFRRTRCGSRSTYWFPRMLGGPLGIALWAVLGFFNGIGRPTDHSADHGRRGR